MFEIKTLHDQSPARDVLILKIYLTFLYQVTAHLFSSNPFQLFAAEYDFNHVASSPNYTRANSKVERVVFAVRAMLCKNEDLYPAHLAYILTVAIATEVPAMPSVLKPSV